MHEELDLNKIREQARQGEVKNTLPEKNGDSMAINTRERFEALSTEEQERRMQEKGYTDLELFKNRHFGEQGRDMMDINKLRAQLNKGA